MSGRQAHRAGTLLLAAAMVAIGVALLVEAAAVASTGVPVLRVAIGVLFAAAGVGRIYIELRRGGGR